MVLDTGMSPVSFSVANVLKRVSVVVASIVFFANPVSPMNWAGSRFSTQERAKRPNIRFDAI